jgi:hypothetical protein
LRISLVFALSGLDGFIAFELKQTKPSRLYSNLLALVERSFNGQKYTVIYLTKAPTTQSGKCCRE